MSKVTTLSQAIAATVKPKATLLFGFTHNRSHAAVYEVARQFKGSHALTIVATGLLEYASILCAAKAVGGLQSAFAGNTYPAPSPSSVLSAQLAELEELESFDPDWTNLTMTLRLQAGAMGWPFIPTASFTAQADISKAFGRTQIQNPYWDQNEGEAEHVTVLPALQPDVAFLHAPIADTHGNTLIEGPDAESLWGLWAAKKVVITAEKIISPEEFRKLAPCNGFPGSRVDYVIEAPFGAHPQGQFIWRKDLGLSSYAEDYAFRKNLRKLTRTPEALNAWLEEWVYPLTHDAYINKLGTNQLGYLQNQAENPTQFTSNQEITEISAEELAAIAAKRLAVQSAAQGDVDIFFAGIGLSHLAAWAAEEECRNKEINIDLVAETGMYGFRPLKGDPYLFNKPNAANALFHSGFTHMLGALAGPRSHRLLAFLAAGQIDIYGNINSSRTAKGGLIVGSGGANDLVSGAADYMIVMPLSKGRFVEELPFITSPVGNLKAVATNFGTLTRAPNSTRQTPKPLIINSLYAEAGAEQITIDKIRETCGVELDIAEDLTLEPPPTREEISALRSFDPERIILT